ncbi:hypothetical protein HDU97_002181 [Phlyctochytrium planicorne]|nr:hypothetical protein HDU97_002181 [Phlyctochytrium planicorne]
MDSVRRGRQASVDGADGEGPAHTGLPRNVKEGKSGEFGGVPLSTSKTHHSKSSMYSTASHAVKQTAHRLVEVKFVEQNNDYYEKRKISYHSAGIIEQLGVMLCIQLSGATAGWIDSYDPDDFLFRKVILAEMMLMLPFTGGMATYSRAAFGPYIGYVVGACEMWEYILIVAQNLAIMGHWICSTLNMSDKFSPMWWFIQLLFMLFFQLFGNKAFLNIMVVLASPLGTTLALLKDYNPWQWGILAAFESESIDPCLDSTSPDFNLTLCNSTAIDLGNLTMTLLKRTDDETFSHTVQDALFLQGFLGVVKAIPSALLMYLGIEVLPLMVEESKDFKRSGPKSIFIAQGIATFVFWFVLIFQPGFNPGVLALADTDVPLVVTLTTAFHYDEGTVPYNLIALFTLMTTVFGGAIGCAYAFSRQSLALARGGYLPTFMSFTKVYGKKEQVPWASLLVGCFLIVAVASLSYAEGPEIIEALGTTGTLYASIAYGCTGAAYLFLKYKFSHIKRPWSSSAGIPRIVAFNRIIFDPGGGSSQSNCLVSMHWKNIRMSPAYAPQLHSEIPIDTETEAFIQNNSGKDGKRENFSHDAEDFMAKSGVSLGVSKPKLEVLLEEEEEGSQLELESPTQL